MGEYSDFGKLQAPGLNLRTRFNIKPLALVQVGIVSSHGIPSFVSLNSDSNSDSY